jgi:hypothetical protein
MNPTNVRGVISVNKEFPIVFWFVALLSGFRFRFVGDFYVGEILAVLIVLDNTLNRKRSVSSRTNLDKYLYFWLIFQLISNLVNSTSFVKAATISGSVIITFMVFKAVYILAIRGYSINKTLMCIFLGQAFAGFLQPKDYGNFNGWKYQYGYFLGAFLVFFLAEKSRIFLCQITLILLSVFSVANSARSLAAFFLITFFISILGINSSQSIRTSPKIAIKLGGILLLLISIYAGYVGAAKAGYFGAKELTRANKLTATVYGPLAGRSEIFYTIKAISQKPLLGYGGDPLVSNNLLLETASELYSAGVRSEGGLNKTPDTLPLHSIILNTAVFAGIPATLIWIHVLLLSSRFILRMHFLSASDRIMLTLISLSQIWNILFSPYGALLRLTISGSIAFLYVKYTSIGSLNQNVRRNK